MGNTTSSSNYYKGSGSGASATSSLIFNSVGVVTLTGGGNGYTSPPTVTFSGGGGSGASATATISNGVVTSVTIDNGGQGYASAPTVTFTSVTAIDIRNIVTGSGVSQVGEFQDFPTLESTTYENMRPLLLNYSNTENNSGDLMNVAAASNNCYTFAGTNTVPVPNGAKAIRVISLSGAGGQGGAGGKMRMTSNQATGKPDRCTANGGGAGLGGYGKYSYSDNDISLNGETTIKVTVGPGGGAGSTGWSGSSKNKSGAKAGWGNDGGPGGSSYVKIGSDRHVTSTGGNGGGGGEGGKGSAKIETTSCWNGTPGTDGTPRTKQYNQSTEWPNFATATGDGVPLPGVGGGGVGTAGEVRIIWLFGD